MILQRAFMNWELRIHQKYFSSLHLPRKQQWICYIHKPSSCSFSKTSGAVRYVPKTPKTDRPQRPDKPQKASIKQPVDGVGKNVYTRRLPFEAKECSTDPTPIRARAEAGEFDVVEKNDTDMASTSELTQSQLFDVAEPHMSLKRVPLSSKNGIDQRQLFDPLGNVDENSEEREIVSRAGSTIWPGRARLQTDSKRKPSSAGLFCGNTAHLISAEIKQTWDRDEGRLATRQELTKVSSRFDVQDTDRMPKEISLERRNQRLWQDSESFLQKIQSLKLKTSASLGMSHTAITDDCKADTNSRIADNKESLERNRIFHGAPTSAHLYSKAEQEHAKNQAIRYLSMNPYTAADLRKKLIGRSIEPGLADYAIAAVQNCGLQSDMAYAETFSFSRFKHGGWGPQKIKLGLRKKGVKDEIIAAAIDKVFHEEEDIIELDNGLEDADTLNYTGVGMSKTAMDHLLMQATKKWNQGRNVTMDTKVRRMFCWLQYRGFNYSVIRLVLQHLRQGNPLED